MAALAGALQDRRDVLRKRDPRLRVGLRGRQARQGEYARTDDTRQGHPGHLRPGTPDTSSYHDSLQIYTSSYGNIASLRPTFPTVKPFNPGTRLCWSWGQRHSTE